MIPYDTLDGSTPFERHTMTPAPAEARGHSAAAPADPADLAAVGQRIRALREGMGMSLRELALRCGVGAATLSQVERGESSPTLAVAARIAEGLELSLSQLLRLDESRHVVIVRSGSGRRSSRGGHAIEELTPPLPGQRCDVSIHRLEPGTATGGAADPPIHEPGSRETVVVLDGEVELAVDGDTHLLAAGDAVTFDADLPHNLRNPARERARLLAVIAAGLRRS